MASFHSSLPKLGRLGATFVTRRYVQGGSQEAAKRGLNEAIRIGETLTNHPAVNTKETAEMLAEKAKKAAEEALESAMDTSNHHVENTQDAANESVEEIAERNMNTKNYPTI